MKRDKMITKFFALLDKVEDSSDPKVQAATAIELCQMFINKELGTPKVIKNDKLAYYEHSRLKNKCSKCNTYYLSGEPCFVMNGKGWHEACGSVEDLQFPYYLACKKNTSVKQDRPEYKPPCAENDSQFNGFHDEDLS